MALPSLNFLKEWGSFEIDALGLVTILGASEVERALGQLTRNRWADWLPILGGHIIANNQITEPLPGFSLHNISDGIMATDLAGWFSRWMLSQDFTMCSSLITIVPTPPLDAKHLRHHLFCSLAFGCIGFACLIVPIVIGDWWGVANGFAMLASVIVRRIVVGQNSMAVGKAMEAGRELSDEDVKVFLTMPNGKAITIYTTRGIVIECLLTQPEPPNPRLYNATRSAGWVAFGVHVIALGMSCLMTQIIAVVVMIISSIIVCRQIGTDRSHIGSMMKIKRIDSAVPFRAAAYSRLELSDAQENSMVMWNLFPHRTNEGWWEKYNRTKASKDFANWDKELAKTD